MNTDTLANKKKLDWIENKYELRTKENYEPWLSEREFAGQGTLIVLKNCSFKRNHILFSKLQEQVLLELLYQEEVMDIREHYPVLTTGDDKVICTTFMVSRKKKDQVIDEAISVIREINNSNKNRIKFQENHWMERGIVYKVITEEDLLGKENRIYNYKLFYQAKCNIDNFKKYKEELLFKKLYKQISKEDVKAGVVIGKFKETDRLQVGEYLKYMIAHGVVSIDWDKKFDLNCMIKI
ncbi:MAG TPA: hypothetical protein GX707_13730 [Epulopiscium sp.]|nr:hypothetical protein [Candidatus Epulonipiscium sp.]